MSMQAINYDMDVVKMGIVSCAQKKELVEVESRLKAYAPLKDLTELSLLCKSFAKEKDVTRLGHELKYTSH